MRAIGEEGGTVKLGLGLYNHLLKSENYRFARQAGATHLVIHTPIFRHGGDPDATPALWTEEDLRGLKAAINAEGLEFEAIENFLPAHWYDVLLDGPRKAEQLEDLKEMIRAMGRAGIPVMGYNFSIAGVWGRVEGQFARGGARSLGFENPEQLPIPNGMVWNMVYDPARYNAAQPRGTVAPVTSEQLWARFAEFLAEVVPVAEQAGVKLALHPDDPPLPELRGTARLVHTPEGYQRVLDLSPSPANAMEFCVGTLSEIPGADIYDMVERYSRTGRIAYVHLRNVRGAVPYYYETFVDEGETDMIRVLRLLRDSGYSGVLIPDHTPHIECAAPWHAGMAYALGYMKAAITLIEAE